MVDKGEVAQLPVCGVSCLLFSSPDFGHLMILGALAKYKNLSLSGLLEGF